MTAACSSGHCAMPAERTPGKSRWLSLTAGLLLLLAGMSATGAEAPGADSSPPPLPPEAEAAHQDLTGRDRAPQALDEAIFTEISPLTIPEIGITLPADQEL